MGSLHPLSKTAKVETPAFRAGFVVFLPTEPAKSRVLLFAA
jgi:hypothetical protein